VLLSLVTVTALVLGGASAAMATPATTTTYSTPEIVPGAPTGVSAVSIEYQGLLITTVMHDDGTFTIEAFDGTSFTVLSDGFLGAQNFVIWNEKVYFSGETGDGWEIYQYDGETFDLGTRIHSLVTYQELVVGPGNELYFTADDGVVTTLYSTVSGGMPAPGANEVSARNSADDLRALVFFDDWVFYSMSNAGDTILMRVDGTTGDELGTGLECDAGLVWEGALYRTCRNEPLGEHLWVLHSGGGFWSLAGSPEVPSELTAFGGSLFFVAIGSDDEFRLFSFDGAVFTEAAGSPIRPAELVVVGDTAFMQFGRYHGSPLAGITAFDGSTFTTVSSANNSANGLISFGGSLYYSGLLEGLVDSPYYFWRVTPTVTPVPDSGAAELAKTGVSANQASGVILGGALSASLLLVGLGALLAMRRRSVS
jgi:LPXTG-motif cell wall-anchored protein